MVKTTTRRAALVIAVCACWLSVGRAEPQDGKNEDEPAAPRVIVGKITDTNGQPIVGALVEWGDFRASTSRLQTRSKQRGLYRLQLDTVGKSDRLGVYAEGYAPAWHDGLIPARGKSTEISFQLSPAAWIEGVVISSLTKKPVAGAKVKAQTASRGFMSSFSMPVPPTPFPGPVRETVTDEQGRFRLAGLGDGGYGQQAKNSVTLVIRAPNHLTHSRNHPLNATAEISLSGGAPAIPGILKVRVLEKETGEPVKQFVIRQRYTTKGTSYETEDGRFEEEGIRAGRSLHRFVYAVGYAPLIATVQTRPIDAKGESVVELTKSPAVAGQIVDATTGQPLKDVRIVCARAETASYFPWEAFSDLHDGLHPMKMVQRAVTGEDGKFAFAEGDQQNYLFLYPESGHARTIVKPDDRKLVPDTNQIRIAVPRAASVSGVYTRDGKPLPECQVRIWKFQRTKPEENWETAITDKQGRFRFENLAAGDYSISGYVQRRFKLAEAQQLTLNLGEGLGPHTLTGKAPPFTRIFLRPAFDGWDYGELNTTADADGKYRIPGLKSGKYNVWLLRTSESSGFIQDSHAAVQIDGDTVHNFK